MKFEKQEKGKDIFVLDVFYSRQLICIICISNSTLYKKKRQNIVTTLSQIENRSPALREITFLEVLAVYLFDIVIILTINSLIQIDIFITTNIFGIERENYTYLFSDCMDNSKINGGIICILRNVQYISLINFATFYFI